MCGVSCGEEAKNETNDQKLLVLCEDPEAKPKSIEVLLEAGADVETRSTNGCTPLIYAAWRNSNPEVIEALLKAGANSEVKDDDGKIALDYAMEYKKYTRPRCTGRSMRRSTNSRRQDLNADNNAALEST